jgi:hypothetical protein
MLPRQPHLIQDEILSSKGLFEPLEARRPDGEGANVFGGKAVLQYFVGVLRREELVEQSWPLLGPLRKVSRVVRIRLAAGGEVDHKFTVLLGLVADYAPTA